MINQRYRGDPEQKQYTLYDNFSGGINSADSDESLNSNEFRNLINVEINSRGVVENRKGFKELSLFNELLGLKGIELPAGAIHLFKIISDKYNLFQKFSQYDTLENFINETANYNTYFKILMVINNSMYLLKYDNVQGYMVSEDEFGVLDLSDIYLTLNK